MSADLLRRAASLMRERAEVAIDATGEGAWQVTGIGWNNVQGQTWTVKRGIQTGVCEALCEEQSEHIASWHPAVALAVAKLFDNLAVDYADMTLDGRTAEDALAVARAYLGEA